MKESGANPKANFYQKATQEKRCYCCGSNEHLFPKCGLKDTVNKNKWFQNTQKCLFQEVHREDLQRLKNQSFQQSEVVSVVTTPTVVTQPPAPTSSSDNTPDSASAAPTQVSAAQTTQSTHSRVFTVHENTPGLGIHLSQVHNLHHLDSQTAGVCLLNGNALKNIVLLDNQSTCHIFSHKDFIGQV